MRTEYDDVIRAWLDGGEYEYRVDANDRWHKSIGQPYLNPITHPEFEWRIKPEKQVLKYRVAILEKDGQKFTQTADSTDDAIELASCPYFVEWLHGDWQEVEVG